MKIESLDDLLAAVRQSGVLEEEQQEQLDGIAAGIGHQAALAHDLERRGWLTPYQAGELLAGRGGDLVLGQYVILSLLGQGGMGKVFKARHRLMKRIVALKVINPALLQDARAIQRFHREIQAVASLSHPNIVAAFDADYVGTTHFLVMEYVEGIDLNRLVKQVGPLPPGVACEFVRQAALGLQHAHTQGMVHRDIKPHNLLVTRGPAPALAPVVKILDLGLARLHAGDIDGMTNTGAVMGTPDFIAPEQASDSHTVDIRADLYSLGCTLYLLLTGEPPFPGGTALDKVFKHKYVAPRPVEVRRPEVPAGIAAVVARLLAKRPEDRYQTPAEVADTLAPLASLVPDVLPASLAPVEEKPDLEGLARTLRRGRPHGTTQLPDMGETGDDLAVVPAEPRGKASAGAWSDVPPPYVGPGGAAAAVGELPKPVPKRRRGAGCVILAGLLLAGAAVAGVVVWPLVWPHGGATDGGITGGRETGPGPLKTNLDDTRSGPATPTQKATEPGKITTDAGKDTGKAGPVDTGKAVKPKPTGVALDIPKENGLTSAAFAAGGSVALLCTRQIDLDYCTNLDDNSKAICRGHAVRGINSPIVPTASGISATGRPAVYASKDIHERGAYLSENALHIVQNSASDTPVFANARIPRIACLAVSDDTNRVLAGTTDGREDVTLTDKAARVYLWDLTNLGSPAFRRAFSGHADKKAREVTSVFISSDGKHAVSSGRGDAVRWWEVGDTDDKEEAKEQGSVETKAQYVVAVALSPVTGDHVLYGGDDQMLHYLNFKSGKPETTFQTTAGGDITAVAFSPSGLIGITGNHPGAVLLWDLKSGKSFTPEGEPHDNDVIAVAMSSDGKYVYSVGLDYTIRRFRTPPQLVGMAAKP